jgi:phospholipid/cholesterol/gamma-HCH transport system ATP-binding protein
MTRAFVSWAAMNPQAVTTASSATASCRSTEIRVEDLHKSFGNNHVLRGINLEIHSGEMVAIVGGSGSGKTVLLRHLLGDFKPDRGHIWIADHEAPNSPLVDLATLDDEGMDHLRRHWAVVFQGNALFPGTVFENIALVLREVKGLPEAEIRRKAEEVVQAVGLDVTRVLDIDRRDLSGGMAKRVGIARALALDPMLIFYDEPTSGLDPNLAHQIQDLIGEAHHRKNDSTPSTTIMITHDKELLYRLGPRVVMLHGGVVAFDGPYDDFRQTDSSIVRPYLELMPGLHQRIRGPSLITQFH